MQITTIGIDLAKTVFQVHASMRMARRLFANVSDGRRCSRSCRVWTMPDRDGSLRDIALLGARTCKVWAHCKADASGLREAYVKRGKNDATDAEAICEAVSRPNMRFVPVKSADQQAVLMLHRTRALLIRQQTMLANAFGRILRSWDRGRARHQACARLIGKFSARIPLIFLPWRARHSDLSSRS